MGEPSRPAGLGATDGGTRPTGSVTFLFTDIEGSTALWERQPEAMRAAFARQEALVRQAITAHGGYPYKMTGDAFQAAFQTTLAALGAALDAQRALAVEPWPEELGGPLRVRMALHTGQTEERPDDYVGPLLNRLARLLGAGHGGQVLLSAASAALVREALPPGLGLRELGEVRLRDLARAEPVFQLTAPGLQTDFPPLRSLSAQSHNLPETLTSFIGREAEVGAVRALLSTARLVTLTGTGGAGKTRLAVAVAGELVDEYPDGVWLTELAPLADPALVPQAVALALGLREEPNRPLLATLTAQLTPRRLLLVLDNCEHLIGACADLAVALLRGCPRLHLLATSRETLGVPGETTYRVPSLAVPDLVHLPAPDHLPAYPAIALFVQRAQSRRPDFTLTPQNARAVAQVCARLDGLPLAIELAAARVGSLPVEAIAARLDDRFRLLTTGPRTALPRQQTLRAALDWSYDLLAEGEQRLLDRLSVFAGGGTLEAAAAVCGGDRVGAWEVLDLLGGLVNKSLVTLEEREGDARYRLLETVRQYSWERLAATGEEATRVRERHLRWCLALAEAAEPYLTGPAQVAWAARLEGEHDNLRAALGWAWEGGEGAHGLALAAALSRFWELHGHLREGRAWLERLLAREDGPNAAPPVVRARALLGAGWLAHCQVDSARAQELLDESLALFSALGHRAGMAEVLINRGLTARMQGEYVQAVAAFDQCLTLQRAAGTRAGSGRAGLGVALYRLSLVWRELGAYERATALGEECLALQRALGDQRGVAVALLALGDIARDQGDAARAQAYAGESLALFEALGGAQAERGFCLNNLGLAAYLQGDLPRAAALCAASVATFRALEMAPDLAEALVSLGTVAQAQGVLARAHAVLAEGLGLAWRVGPAWVVAAGLAGLASVAAAQRQAERAARLWGAATARRTAMATPPPAIERIAYEAAVPGVRAALGDGAFAAAWTEGAALLPAQAIAYAVGAPYSPPVTVLSLEGADEAYGGQAHRTAQGAPRSSGDTEEIVLLPG